MSNTTDRAADRAPDHAAGGRAGTFDVAIVGGSFAGLSAVYPLVRARRSTILFDTGETRNRFSSESHNWIGLDGVAPPEVHRTAVEELRRYPDFTLAHDRVASVAHADEADDLGLRPIDLTTTRGRNYQARRLILATGMRDAFPQIIDGLEECWGLSALQCPYCHGYEERDRPTGILHGGPPSLHQAKNLPDFSGDLVYFANGATIEASDRADLEARGYRIVDQTVRRVVHDRGRMTAIGLENGAEVARDVLYIIPRSAFAADLHLQLGCAETEGPFGPYVAVDDLQETSVRGVFAAGDMTRPAFNAVWAGGDGNRAGIFAHQSLVAAHNPYRGAKL